MKLLLSTSFSREPLESTLAAVRELGFTGIDLIAIPQWPHIELDDLVANYTAERDRVTALLASSGVRVANFNAGIGALADRGDEALASRNARARALARLMQDLKVPRTSLYPGYKAEPPTGAELDAIAISLQELRALAADIGGTFILEPHWRTPVATPAHVTALHDRDPGLRIALDPSHFLASGDGPATWEPLYPLADHVHVRDAAPDRIHVPCGTGDLDLPGFVDALHARSYAGDIALEVLPDKDHPTAARDDVARLRDQFAAVGVTP